MSSTLSDNDIDAIRQLLKMVSENDLTELSITVREGVSVTIKCATAQAQPYTTMPTQLVSYQPQAQVQAAQPQSLPSPASSPAAKKGNPVKSPATGIYYQSPSPGEPPFIKVGETIKAGQVIGLLEAMKVFSEIHSDTSGKVLEICAVDGQLVRDEDPILMVG